MHDNKEVSTYLLSINPWNTKENAPLTMVSGGVWAANPNFQASVTGPALIGIDSNRLQQAHRNSVWGRSLCPGL